MVTENSTLLVNAALYLGAAIVAVPLAKRLGLGAVLGYLLAGIAIGPWGLQWVTDAPLILQFAEFGVVLLLFIIGLELNPRRLWDLRTLIIGLGGLQVLLTTALLAILAIAMGVKWQVALVAGMGLSLSSTAIALQSMTEKNLLSTPAGRNGFATLLLQDIAVIPMLAIIPLLGHHVRDPSDENGWMRFGYSVLAIVIVIAFGRYLTRPVLRLIANTKSREIFTAFSLFMVIAIALAMQAVDLSMGLGSFLAGVLLAESEYRHQLEADIEPFKGLLLGLFFIAIGMTIDFSLLVSHPWIIAGLILSFVTVKVALLLLLARRFNIPLMQRAYFAFVLAQGGEFAFVLFGVATDNSVIPKATADILNVVVAFSMLITPLMLMVNQRFIEPRLGVRSKPPHDIIEPAGNPVVIAGFGRFGQIVARLLHANKIGTTIIEHDPDQVDRVRKFGFKVFYGDVSRLDLLHAADLAHAKVFILATDDRESGLRTVDLIREHFPHVVVLARAWDLIHVYQLKDHGAHGFQRETFDSALRLGVDTLVALGRERHAAHRAAQQYRAYDQALIDKLYEVHKDQGRVISLTQESRDEVERLLAEDERVIRENSKEQSWG